MKKILYILSIAVLFTANAASGQMYRTAYFMEGSTMRNSLNPAFRPYRGYVNIPGAGNLAFNFNSSSLAVNDIFYPVNGQLVSMLDKNVTWQTLSGRLEKSNDLGVDVRANILGFGFYSGKSFWSFSVDVNAEAGGKLPKEIFEFLKQGSGSYDVRDLTVGANAIASASLGYSRRIFENLTVGGRINFLGGLGRAQIHYDRLDLVLNKDIWSVNASGNLEVAIDGFEMRDKQGEPGVLDLESLDGEFYKNTRGLAGTGLSFDVGAEYKLLDRITFSASILNMGYMKWNNVTAGRSEASYEFQGVNVNAGGNGGFEGDLEEGLADFTKFRRVGTGDVRSKMFATVVLGAELDIFGNDILGLGVTYMNKKTEYTHRSELSAAITLRPTSWVTAAVSYAFQNYKDSDNAFNSVGMALNFHASWINFFVGSDFMITKIAKGIPIPVNQRNVHLYMGIAIPLAKEKPQKMIRLGL